MKRKCPLKEGLWCECTYRLAEQSQCIGCTHLPDSALSLMVYDRGRRPGSPGLTAGV